MLLIISISTKVSHPALPGTGYISIKSDNIDFVSHVSSSKLFHKYSHMFLPTFKLGAIHAISSVLFESFFKYFLIPCNSVYDSDKLLVLNIALSFDPPTPGTSIIGFLSSNGYIISIFSSNSFGVYISNSFVYFYLFNLYILEFLD